MYLYISLWISMIVCRNILIDHRIWILKSHVKIILRWSIRMAIIFIICMQWRLQICGITSHLVTNYAMFMICSKELMWILSFQQNYFLILQIHPLEWLDTAYRHLVSCKVNGVSEFRVDKWLFSKINCFQVTTLLFHLFQILFAGAFADSLWTSEGKPVWVSEI